MELGYHVSYVLDITAVRSPDVILTTAELIAAIKAIPAAAAA
jgi:hypothetical protein